MKETLTQSIRRIGKMMAQSLYKDFTTDPRNMGPNWDWKKFPDFMRNKAEREAFIYINMENENVTVNMKQRLKKICGESAYKEAKKLMKK